MSLDASLVDANGVECLQETCKCSSTKFAKDLANCCLLEIFQLGGQCLERFI